MHETLAQYNTNPRGARSCLYEANSVLLLLLFRTGMVLTDFHLLVAFHEVAFTVHGHNYRTSVKRICWYLSAYSIC